MKDIQLYDIINNPHKVNVILTDNALEFANEIYVLVQGNHFNIDDEAKWALKKLVKDIEYYEGYFDRVIIPECVGRTHPKGAITKRNKWMVEQADLLICYVERENGGAYAALKYAKALQKEIINLAGKD